MKTCAKIYLLHLLAEKVMIKRNPKECITERASYFLTPPEFSVRTQVEFMISIAYSKQGKLSQTILKYREFDPHWVIICYDLFYLNFFVVGIPTFRPLCLLVFSKYLQIWVITSEF